MRIHIATITLVVLIALAVWWLSLMPAQAQLAGPPQPPGTGGTGCTTSGATLLKGNNTGGCANAVSGTDFAPATTGTAILKGNNAGGFTSAVAGTDYAPITTGTAILKGNNAGGFSSAVSGTDYAPATSGTAILKGNNAGAFANAVSGTDYAPATAGNSVLKANGAGGFANAVGGTDFAPATTGSSILKANGTGGFANATSGTDYAPATSGSSLLKGNGAGGFSNASSGVDYAPATSGSSVLVGNGAGGFSLLSGNTLASHNFATSIGANGTISGAQPAFTDISGTAQKAQGGTGTTYGATGAFTQKTNSATGTTANSLYVTDSSQNAVNVTAGATSGVLGICDSGCSTSGTGTFFSGPGDHTCNFDGSVTAKDYVGISASVNGDCTDLGAALPTGTELIGQVDQATAAGAGAYTVFFYGPDFPGTGGGGVNTGVLGNSPLYAATTTIGPVTNEIHANTSTLAAALAAVTQARWTSTHGYIQGSLLYDGTNTERIADWQPSTSYASSGATSVLVPFTGNNGGYRFTETVASCTSGTTKPTWNQTPAGTVSDGTCSWTNASATGCTSGGSTPAWSGTLGGVVLDGNCPWMNVIKGAAAPSVQSNIVLDPGKTYTVSTATMIGGTNVGQTLNINGATISCTDTNGAGHGCIVAGNWSKIVGSNRNTSFISAAGTASIDAVLETEAAYLYSALGLEYQQVNEDVEHVGIIPGGATIAKAAFWVSGIDGDGNYQDLFVGGSTATNIPAGILVDDAPTGSAFTGMLWNALNFRQVWIGMGTDVYGLKVLCGATTGSSGSNLVWNGGAIVDGSNQATAEALFQGVTAGSCRGITQENTYYESLLGQTGNFVNLSGASNVWLNENVYNGGPTLTDCISIANAAANNLHASGYAATCTDIIANAVTGQTLTYAQSGSLHGFRYDWDNPSFSASPINQVGGLINPFGPGGPAGLYYSAAGTALPACATAYERYFECVSDSTACVSGTTYTSGGSTGCLVQCNNAGTAWKETGIGCQ